MIIAKNYKIISVVGGSGSGKSYFSNQLSKKLDSMVIELDSYIIPEKITKESNWDLPEVWDLKLVRAHLEEFLKGNKFKRPLYDFRDGTRFGYEIILPNRNLILEGLYSLSSVIEGLVDFSIFVDVNEKERLNRVLKRDVAERRRKTNEKIIKRWNDTIQPAYLDFVEPQKDRANIVLVG